MSGFSVSAENKAVEAIKAAATFISLHDGDPGETTGANEISGGTYARIATTWPASATNSSITGSAVTLNVPAGENITHWGLWSTVTAGTFYFSGPLPAPETFGSNGTYSLTPTLSASD